MKKAITDLFGVLCGCLYPLPVRNILVAQVGQVPSAAFFPFFRIIAARKMYPIQPVLIPRLFWC